MGKWNELEFEWDMDKAASNLKKHGVDFIRACLESPRTRLPGGFSAAQRCSTLKSTKDSCGFAPCSAKNPLGNPHTLRFQTGSKAARVFDDVNRKEYYDEEHSEHEDRYNTIGMVDNVLFVAYTQRRNRIRIISARNANRAERRLYYGR